MMALFNHLHTLFLKGKNSLLKNADPAFLLFLLLVTNYRFSFKIIAIIAIYIYQPNFKFKKSGITYFYSGMILLAIFNLCIINRDFRINHIMVVFTGCLLWASCLLIYHQVSLFIEKNSIDKVIHTLKILVVINFLFSIADLIKIMMVTHTLNPYVLASPPPYGISSGDLIGGVFGEMHLVNMTISSLLLLFFLYQKNFLYSCFTIIPLLLTGSNFGTIISVSSLLYVFIVNKDNLIRYYVLFSIAIVLVFYIKVTPENLKYLNLSLTKVTSQFKHPKNNTAEVKVSITTNTVIVKSEEEIKNEKIHNYIVYKYGNNINDDSIYHIKQAFILKEQAVKQQRIDYCYYVKDSLRITREQDKKFDYGNLKKFDFDAKSGKAISFLQTKDLLLSDYRYFMFGAGLGSFSSRLAFITSGIVDDSRVLMSIPKYENPLFAVNHKAIFKYLLFLDDEYHSITNLPFCWYNELLGEYGIIGLILFIIYYFGFFITKRRLLTFGRIVLVMILLFFFFDYWYQRLSVMVFFELLMLLDIKIQSEKNHKEIQE